VTLASERVAPLRLASRRRGAVEGGTANATGRYTMCISYTLLLSRAVVQIDSKIPTLVREPQYLKRRTYVLVVFVSATVMLASAVGVDAIIILREVPCVALVNAAAAPEVPVVGEGRQHKGDGEYSKCDVAVS